MTDALDSAAAGFALGDDRPADFPPVPPGPWLDPGPPGAPDLGFWACLPVGDRYLVAHGPGNGCAATVGSWPLAACSETFDPGASLGNGQPDAPLPTPEIAARVAPLLAHLLQSLLLGVPVVLALTPADLGANAPWPRLAGLARAALPGRLRQRCAMRLPVWEPEPFLGPLGAHLIAIPAELARRALVARPAAVLLDGRGERQAGAAPHPVLTDYAVRVLDGWLRFPHGLVAFGARFDRIWSGAGLPTAAQIDLIPTVYNLAVAVHGSPGQRARLFANSLIDQVRDAGLPWSALVAPHEWLDFPHAPLLAYLLRPADGLAPGERALQDALAAALVQAGPLPEPALAAWWDPADPAKRRRLQTLAADTPGLIAAERLAALGVAPADLPIADSIAQGRRLDPGDTEARRTWATRLAERLERDPAGTTGALIAADVWLLWRRHADLSAGQRRRAALCWLQDPAWAHHRAAGPRGLPPSWRIGRGRDPDRRPPEPGRETWLQVMQDLAGALDPAELDGLLRPATRWPWIYPFESEQIAELNALCPDPEARLRLAAALAEPASDGDPS